VREAFTHIRADHTTTQVVTVENNTSLDTDTYASLRSTYTGVSSVPVKKIDVDHTALGGGGTWNTHYTWIDTALHGDITTTPASINLSYVVNSGVVTMTAVLSLDAALTGTHRMWMVCTEDVAGNPDNNPHYYARVGKVGTLSDMLVTITSAGQTQTFTWTFKPRSTWVWTGATHQGVAFVELDSGTKEVIQSKQISMSALNGTLVQPASLGSVKSLYR
jgi:hypothetical protein